MTDLSALGPIDRWAKSAHPERRCTAHRKNGDQCKNAARQGTNVCDFHGAKAPQVKAKARQRLEEAADRMAKELLGIATGAESEAVKLAAIRDALDRAGVSAKQALELSAAAEPQPYEELLLGIAGIATITRAESRAARGLPAPETPELPPPQPHPRALLAEVVDAELVDPAQEPDITAPDSPADSRTAPTAPDSPADTPANGSGPMKGLVSFEEAVTETQTRTRVTRVKRLR